MADVKLDAGFEEVPLDQGFEEVPLESQPAEPTSSDAALAGLAQGTTFGFSDELGAAKDIASDYLTNNKLGKSWREYQKLREAENKKLAESNPVAYTAGEVGGGVASSLLMPSMGAARVAAGAAKLSPKIAALIAKNGLAGKAITEAVKGAPIGLGYGIGSSENDISKPTELTKDAASGLLMGSATGAGLSLAASGSKAALNKAGSMVEDSPLLRQVREGFRMGDEGINLASGAKQEELSILADEKAGNFVERIMKTDKEIGKKVGEALEKAQNNGVTINVDPKIQSVGERIFKTIFVDNPTLGELMEPRTAQVFKTLAAKEKGSLSPIEARAMKDQLYSMVDKLAGYNSDTANLARGLSSELAKEVDVAMKNAMPEYQTAAREFEAFRKAVPETIISKGKPNEYSSVYMGDLKNPKEKLFTSTRDVLKKSQLPGESASGEKAAFQRLKMNLSELQKNNPEAIKSLGGETAEDVVAKIRNDSDRLAAVRLSHGVDPQAGIGEAGRGALSGLATTGRGVLVSGANQAGRVSGAITKSAPAKMSKAVFQAGEDQLQGLAQRLKSSPSSETLGNALENALVNKNDAAKNAVLFKMMQTPEYRNLLRDSGLEEDQSNEQ